jgi:hypothetical protein
MTFSIGGKQRYEPSAEATFLLVQAIHNIATEWIGKKGKMPKYLYLNRDDFYEGEEAITAACWQYSRDFANVIEPIWDPDIPRGMLTLLSADEYVHRKEVAKVLREMAETPELLPVF